MSNTKQTPDQMTLQDILNVYLLNIQRGGHEGTEMEFGTARGISPYLG